MNKRYNFILPLLFAVMVALGMLIGSRFSPKQDNRASEYEKFSEVMTHIENSYLDTINKDQLLTDAIINVISDLDPHSFYIDRKELVTVNQDLGGNFDGIGVEFNILNDTIIIVSPISGGPSEALGIRAGDKIITIEGENVAGTGITTDGVRKRLLGKKGTQVNIQIFRSSENRVIDFSITRDKIPLYSIDASYLVTPEIGYIKVNRFSSTTAKEFLTALKDLKNKGMNSLILDLSGNPGGYLEAAFRIADQFFSTKKLIVYTEGRARPRTEYFSTNRGLFSQGKLVVIIDEGSASASEILAGAIQDWDRGILIGRRTFGKGLVQEQIPLSDNSALRLTVARYYTPSGRCIQKPFKGKAKNGYYMDMYHRYANGELTKKDSVHQVDSLKYETFNGRIVFGGGGITPDVFVPLDTSYSSGLLSNVNRLGLVNRFTLEYIDKNRNSLENTYDNFAAFDNNFDTKPIFRDFLDYAHKNKVNATAGDIEKSGIVIETQLKALIARQLFGPQSFFKVINQINEEFKKAIEVIQSDRFRELDIESIE